MIDSICFGNWHLHFNSQLIVILSNIASVVEYRGAQNIGEGKPNVNRKKLVVINGTKRWVIPLRFAFSFFNDIWQLIVAPRGEILVYCFDSTVSLKALNALNKILCKRVIMFRHGSLEMLNTEPIGKGFYFWFENVLTRQFFLNSKLSISKNIHFFVLGDVILKNLFCLIDHSKKEHFHSIDHPYEFDKNLNKIHKYKDNFLKIGTVGVLNEFKGGKNLISLAKILKCIGVTNIELSITGKIDFDTSGLKEAGIKLPNNFGKKMLSVDEFNKSVDELDYIIFLYPVDTNKYTASGAIFDAINRMKPIIAIKNDYFDYLFQKIGEFGYLVENLEEMADLIHNISIGIENPIEYDFKNIQSLISLEKITDDFKNKLVEIGYIL